MNMNNAQLIPSSIFVKPVEYETCGGYTHPGYIVVLEARLKALGRTQTIQLTLEGATHWLPEAERMAENHAELYGVPIEDYESCLHDLD